MHPIVTNMHSFAVTLSVPTKSKQTCTCLNQWGCWLFANKDWLSKDTYKKILPFCAEHLGVKEDNQKTKRGKRADKTH